MALRCKHGLFTEQCAMCAGLVTRSNQERNYGVISYLKNLDDSLLGEPQESFMSGKGQAEEETKGAVSLCEECCERPTLGSSPLCASCMAKRSNKSKAAKKGILESREVRKKPAKEGSSIALPEKGPPGQNNSLTIHFGSKHASMLREIEKLADEELRPVEFHVIYMLRNQLRNPRN